MSVCAVNQLRCCCRVCALTVLSVAANCLYTCAMSCTSFVFAVHEVVEYVAGMMAKNQRGVKSDKSTAVKSQECNTLNSS